MPPFQVVSEFEPTGDQPHAIAQLAEGLRRDMRHQALLGVTGSGKTYTMAKVIEQVQKPTLILAHNKTLAAQLYSEMREFFPNNAVEISSQLLRLLPAQAYIHAPTHMWRKIESTRRSTGCVWLRPRRSLASDTVILRSRIYGGQPAGLRAWC